MFQTPRNFSHGVHPTPVCTFQLSKISRFPIKIYIYICMSELYSFARLPCKIAEVLSRNMDRLIESFPSEDYPSETTKTTKTTKTNAKISINRNDAIVKSSFRFPCSRSSDSPRTHRNSSIWTCSRNPSFRLRRSCTCRYFSYRGTAKTKREKLSRGPVWPSAKRSSCVTFSPCGFESTVS